MSERTPERARVLARVGSHKKVLEVGAHDGHFSSLLIEQGCHVTAVEISPSAAEQARAVVHEVKCGNFEDEDFQRSIRETFDVILFMHVLEHFVDPWKALKASRELLRPEGFVIILLPNVASWRVRKSLFFNGSFEYEDYGILDRTHLRFFTLDSGIELIRNAGFQLVDWESVDTYIPLESRLAGFSGELGRRWGRWMLRRFPNLCTQIFLFQLSVAK